MSQALALTTMQTFQSARVKSTDLHWQRSWAVCGLFNGELTLYDWAAGRVLKTMTVCGRPLRAVRFIPKTNFLVVGADDGVLRLYDSGSLQKRAEVTAHSDCIRCIEIHPTSNELVIFTGGDDGVIRVWSLNNQMTSFQLEQEMHGHTHFVMSLCIDPAGLKLISGSMDMTIKAWDVGRLVSMESFRTKASIVADTPAVGVLQTHSSGFSIDSDDDHGALVNYASLAAQGFTRALDTVLKRGHTEGYSYVDDMKTLMPRSTAVPLFTLFGHEQGVNSVCWCESLNSDVTSNPYYTGGLQYIASAADDMTIRIWDTHSRAVVREFDHHTAGVTSIAYVTGAGYLLAASEDSSMSVINTTSMTFERVMTYSMGRIWTVSYTSEVSGVYAVLGCDHGLVMVQVSENSLKYAAHNGFLAGSQRVFLAVAGVTTADGELVPGESMGVVCCTPSADLKRVEWKTLAVEEVGAHIKSLTYSPNGRFLAVVNEEGYRLISTMTMKKKLAGACYALAFAADCYPKHFIYKDSSFSTAPGADKYVKALSSDRSEEGMYALVDEKRKTLRVHSLAKVNAELSMLRLDYPVKSIASGPLLAIITEDTVVLLDWSRNMKFVCQINTLATSVVWSAAGDMLAIITPTETYVLGINWGYILDNIDDPKVYSEDDGLLEAVTLLHTIDGSVKSLSFSADGESVLYCGGVQETAGLLEGSGGLLYQLSVNELITLLNSRNEKEGSSTAITPTIITIESASKALEIALVREMEDKSGAEAKRDFRDNQIFVLGVPVHSKAGATRSSSLCLLSAKLDNCIIKLRELIAAKKLSEALKLASQAVENIIPAANQLIKAGMPYEEVVTILETTEQKVLLASYAGRVDVLLELFPESEDRDSTDAQQKMADLAFRSGYVNDAYTLYKKTENYAMCLLCAYVLGDTDKLRELATLPIDNALQYRIACALGDDKLAFKALSMGDCDSAGLSADKEQSGEQSGGNPILKYLFADNHKDVADTKQLLKEASKYLQRNGRLVAISDQ